MERKQYTFYQSFEEAAKYIKDPVQRCQYYDVLTAYALHGTKPQEGELSEAVALAYALIKPTLEASRRKAKNGKAGGKSKANGSKREANAKQNESKKEKEGEIEKEVEVEIESEGEDECPSHIRAPARGAPPAPAKPTKQIRHAYGQYGWVKLTDDEYSRLLADLGADELTRCIAYIDESAQSSGNKNRWKDWNLVVRRCFREKWGVKNATSVDAKAPEPVKPPPVVNNERLQRLREKEQNFAGGT